MAWTQRPSVRVDLPLEGRLDLNGSGGYETDWIESSEINTLRVSARFNNYGGGPSLVLEEGVHVAGSDYNGGPFIVRSKTLTVASGKAFEDIELGGRYFRFIAASGGANDYLYISARKVA
jgi:hypothetical protein